MFGPAEGLRLLEHGKGLDRWHLYWATRADLHRHLGQQEDAREAYARALECDMNDEDRRFLQSRLAAVDISTNSKVAAATMEGDDGE